MHSKLNMRKISILFVNLIYEPYISLAMYFRRPIIRSEPPADLSRTIDVARWSHPECSAVNHGSRHGDSAPFYAAAVGGRGSMGVTTPLARCKSSATDSTVSSAKPRPTN